MTGCSALEFISKLGFIPKGILDTPLDRVRICIRKEYFKNNYIAPLTNNVSDADMQKWNELFKILNKVIIHPL